jgi:putative transposase
MLYKNYYRSESNRKIGRDYRLPGWYFVTFCTKYMHEYFGEVRNGIIGLNDLGCIVVDEIHRTNIFRVNIQIPYWVVMPNHVHLLIHIMDKWKPPVGTVRRTVPTNSDRTVPTNSDRTVPTNYMNDIDMIIFDVSSCVRQCIPIFQRQNNSIGDVVRCIKQYSTKRIREKHNPNFVWQMNYHDRILQNESQRDACKNYIFNNPINWRNTYPILRNISRLTKSF